MNLIVNDIRRGVLPQIESLVYYRVTFDMLNYFRAEASLRPVDRVILTCGVYSRSTDEQYIAFFKEKKPVLFSADEIDDKYGWNTLGVNPDTQQLVVDLDYKSFGRVVPHPGHGILIPYNALVPDINFLRKYPVLHTMSFRKACDYIKTKKAELRPRFLKIFQHNVTVSLREWTVIKNELWIIYEMECILSIFLKTT